MTELTNQDLTVADKLEISNDGLFTVHGSGMFDDLMESVTKHLDSQFKLSRLQGSEYANVYSNSLQAAMASAVQYLLGKTNAELVAAQIRKIDAEILKVESEVRLLDAKAMTEAKQLEVLDAQSAMIDEQAKGFQWSANQKYLKTLIDGQSINANIEGVGSAADAFSDNNIDSVAGNTKPY